MRRRVNSHFLKEKSLFRVNILTRHSKATCKVVQSLDCFSPWGTLAERFLSHFGHVFFPSFEEKFFFLKTGFSNFLQRKEKT